MGIQTIPEPAAGSKTRFVVSLTSGTSWLVPTSVTYINATLTGAGGGGGGGPTSPLLGLPGAGGQIISTTVTTTPGNSIAYAIGAGGTAGVNGGASGGSGGSTTFTGATTALGGGGGRTAGGGGMTSSTNQGAINYGNGAIDGNGGAGQSGTVLIEYWI